MPSCRTLVAGQGAPQVWFWSIPELIYSLVPLRWELAGYHPPGRNHVCVCVCVGVYKHIHIPSQIPGPERGIGEDAAPPTCYPGKEAGRDRRGLPGALREQREVDLLALDLRHQVCLCSPHCHLSPHPPQPASSLFPGWRLSLSSAAGVGAQMSQGSGATERRHILFQFGLIRTKKSLKKSKRDLGEKVRDKREAPPNTGS